MRLLTVLGVCVLLFSVTINAAKKKQNKNQSEFWELWDTDGGTDEGNDVPGDGAEDTEFMIDDNEEGSGVDEKDITTNTHEDDEDFPISGDGDPDEETKPNKIVKEDKPDGHTTDDIDLVDDISGSGDGEEQEEVVDIMNKETAGNTDAQPETKPLSACEQLRSTAFSVASYVPECDAYGEFKKLQCMVDIKTKAKSCWCVNGAGRQVPGTMMHQPDEPDCDFGSNLKGCVFQLIQNSQNLLGASKPRCDLSGEWEPIQCLGSQCWCVDSVGNQLLGTVTDLPNMPDCNAAKQTNKPQTTPTPVKDLPKPKDGYTVDAGKKDDVAIVTVSDKGFETEDTEDMVNTEKGYAPVEHQREPILGQPGFLAAIIAGGVITLLLIVLLAMFIVYRMRKKDEGSYPLDEQKYQNYSYAKAPDKEFYA